MDADLLQLLIFVAIVALSLFSGSRKKRRSSGATARRTAPRPPAFPADRGAGDRTGPVSRPMSSPQGPRPTAQRPPDPDAIVRNLYDLLQGRLPTERPPFEVEPTPEEIRSPEVEPGFEELRPIEQERPEEVVEGPEAISLETLEAAGEASHVRFHEKYFGASPSGEPAGGASPVPRRARRVSPRTAREAVIWTAIFGRPKGW